MKTQVKIVGKFDTKNSIKRARAIRKRKSGWIIKVSNGQYTWSNKSERVDIIRSGLPYESIEVISKRTDLSVKQVLTILAYLKLLTTKRKEEMNY